MIDAATVDHTNPEFVAQPYHVFRALREHSALHEHPDWGVRIAVSHAACSNILRHRYFGRIWNDVEPVEDFESFNALHRFNMLENEHDHDRLRAMVSPLFQRRNIRKVKNTIDEIVDEYVSALCECIRQYGSVDLMEHLARPLPVEVIATLLDFPRSDRDLLQDWSNQIVTMYEPTTSVETKRHAERAAQEFRRYVGELIDFRRDHPGEDLLSDLVMTIGTTDSPLTEKELVANYILLLMAGHEASVNGIGNAVAALGAHPAQWELFRSELVLDEGRLNTAVDELLRYDTPNQVFERTATAPLWVEGLRIDEGETVTVLLGAANRDPETFPEPDTLNLTRSPNPHLALGAGTHYCLGAPLARLEIGTSLAAVARHLPDFDIPAPPARRGAFAIRGFDSLYVTTP